MRSAVAKLWLSVLAASLAPACSDAGFSGSTPEKRAKRVETEPEDGEAPRPLDDEEPKKRRKRKKETKGDGAKAEDPPPETEIRTSDDVLGACASKTQKEYVKHLAFPKVSRTCDPSLDFEADDAFNQALVETQPLELPADAVACSFTVTNPQKFMADDEIFVALNGSLLFTSFDLTNQLEAADGLATLDWTRIRGTYYDGGVPNSTPPYCLWTVGGTGGCAITQQDGILPFTGTVGADTSAKLSAAALAEDNAYRIDLMTVEEGDGCMHDAFALDVLVTYIEK